LDQRPQQQTISDSTCPSSLGNKKLKIKFDGQAKKKMEEIEPVSHLLVLAEKKFLLSNDFPKVNKSALVQEILDTVKEKGMFDGIYSCIYHYENTQ